MNRVQKGSFLQEGRMDLEGVKGGWGTREWAEDGETEEAWGGATAFLVWGLTFDPVVFPLEPNPKPTPLSPGRACPTGHLGVPR